MDGFGGVRMLQEVCCTLNAVQQAGDAHFLATVHNLSRSVESLLAPLSPASWLPQEGRRPAASRCASLSSAHSAPAIPRARSRRSGKRQKTELGGPLDPPAEHLGDVLRMLHPRLPLSDSFATLTLDGGKFVVSRAQQAQVHASELLLGRQEANTLFNSLDQDHDGFVSKHEFTAALRNMGLPCGAEYCGELLNQYTSRSGGGVCPDCPGGRGISRADFLTYLSRQKRKLWHAFDDLDADGSGAVSATDLCTALESLGLPSSPRDAQRMITLLDRNGDREVTFSEFCRYASLLPVAQVNSNNTAFCWLDSADYVTSMEHRLGVVPPKQPWQRLVAGGVAGAVSRTMVAPLERLRTIIMATTGDTTLSRNFGKMWADGGFFGMYRGNLATVIKVMPSSAIQFAAYDTAKDIIKQCRHDGRSESLSTLEKLVAGCIAGAVSSGFTYPLETARTVMCIPGASQGGLGSTCRALFAAQGLRGFYQGFGSCVASDIVASGAGFTVYEAGQKAFFRHTGRHPSPAEKGVVGGASAVIVMTFTMPFEVVMRRLQIQSQSAAGPVYRGTVDCFRQIITREGAGALYRGMLSSYLKVAPSIGATYFVYDLLSRRWAIDGIRRYDMREEALEGGSTPS